MKRRTYNNMLKGIEIIQKKGYDFVEANKIAHQIFDNMEQLKNGMSFEWFAEKIATKEEWKGKD